MKKKVFMPALNQQLSNSNDKVEMIQSWVSTKFFLTNAEKLDSTKSYDSRLQQQKVNTNNELK